MSKKVRIPKDGFRIHPAAEIFPMMDDKELAELTASIEHNGLEEPISVIEDQILDGRNRYRVLQSLGRADNPRCYQDVSHRFSFCAEDTLTPLDYVIALNLHRRHLDASQRAAAAVRIRKYEAEEAKKRQGTRTDLKDNIVENFPQCSSGRARDIAAEKMKVSGKSVDMAKKVADHGTSELQEAVRDGKVSVSAAAVIAKEEPEVQRQALTGGKKGVATAAKSRRLSDNELFEQSVKLARAEGHASAAMLQNKFVIGLARAEKMIDRLQRESIIDPDTGQVIEQPTVIKYNFDPHDDLEEILDVYAGEIPDSQVPLYVDLLWAIAANPNVEAIRRVAKRLSED